MGKSGEDLDAALRKLRSGDTEPAQQGVPQSPPGDIARAMGSGVAAAAAELADYPRNKLVLRLVFGAAAVLILATLVYAGVSNVAGGPIFTKCSGDEPSWTWRKPAPGWVCNGERMW